MTTRAELEAEAAELYKYAAVRGNTLVPKQSAIDLAQQAHVRAKTITAEQVEAAAKDMSYIFTDTSRWLLEDITRHAFRAAGLLIEGGAP